MRSAETPRPLATRANADDLVERQEFACRRGRRALLRACSRRSGGCSDRSPRCGDRCAPSRSGRPVAPRAAWSAPAPPHRSGRLRRGLAEMATGTGVVTPPRLAEGCEQYGRGIAPSRSGSMRSTLTCSPATHAGAVGQEDQRVGLGHGMELMGLLTAGSCGRATRSGSASVSWARRRWSLPSALPVQVDLRGGGDDGPCRT